MSIFDDIEEKVDVHYYKGNNIIRMLDKYKPRFGRGWLNHFYKAAQDETLLPHLKLIVKTSKLTYLSIDLIDERTGKSACRIDRF